MYELLAGRKPFDGDSIQTIFRAVLTATPVHARKLNPRVNRYLWNILQRALEKNPEQRYQTAADFAEDLRRYLRREPVVFGRPSLKDRWRRWMYPQSTLARIGTYLTVPFGQPMSFLASISPVDRPESKPTGNKRNRRIRQASQ